MTDPSTPPGSPDAGLVLDPDTVAQLQQAQIDYGNPQFISQLIGIYKKNAPGRVEEIRLAIAARDAAKLAHVAHTLKSNCSMLGALRMARICNSLEDLGDAASFDGTEALQAELAAELPRVLNALDEL